MAQAPEHGDSEYTLIVKIAENYGIVVSRGEPELSILYKIAQKTYEEATS